MTNRDLRYIQLSMMPGWGPVNQKRLLQLCGGIDACFEMDIEKLSNAAENSVIGRTRLETFFANRDSKELLTRALGVAEECDTLGITVITAEDPVYPVRFYDLPDMPLVFYIKGDLKINEYDRAIGVVGARRCSREGKRYAIESTEGELAAGAAIISGMAKGIDSYAHTAALMNNGYTIAVLGSGADVCYPTEHIRLYEQIVLHGCILSEYPPKTVPVQYRFPQRNRLIAALSDKLYVIDAGRNSGTESTVKYGRIYGREIEQHV